MIRRAGEDDDLTPFMGQAAEARWNRDQILVCDLDGRVVGMIVLWDAGHPVIRVDHLCVLDGQSDLVGALLIKGVLDYAKGCGAALISFSTPSMHFVDGALKRGGIVSGPQYRVSICPT